MSSVVSRGGRPDLAGERLPAVRAPTLLIVGERDREVLALNRQARSQMHAETEPMSFQDFLYLSQRLLAQVRRTQQLDFGTLYEIADIHDVLGLEAIG